MSLTVITTSTNRPRQFKTLEMYMSRQTLQPDAWICAGENHTGYSFNMGQQVITTKPSSLHSICENMLAMLPFIKTDKVAVFDDDDWYSPSYLFELDKALDKAPLSGSAPALYYRCDLKRWRDMKNSLHCSLACTGLTSVVIPTLKYCCELGGKFIDLSLWRKWTGEKNIYQNNINSPSQVGLKGLPYGLKGAGLGHLDMLGTPDPDLAVFKRWLGQDSKNYYTSEKKLIT